MLPHDPAMLLSVVNTKLRDEYESLDELCAAEDAEPDELVRALAALGYAYDAKQNRFL